MKGLSSFDYSDESAEEVAHVEGLDPEDFVMGLNFAGRLVAD